MTNAEFEKILDREIQRQLPKALAEAGKTRLTRLDTLELQEAERKAHDRELKESARVFEGLGLTPAGALAAARGREQRY